MRSTDSDSLVAVVIDGRPSCQSRRASRTGGDDGQSACSDHLLAVAPQQTGRPLTDNAIRLVDMNGTEVETVPFDQPGQVFPTSTPGVRLIRSLGGNYALLERDDANRHAARFRRLLAGISCSRLVPVC